MTLIGVDLKLKRKAAFLFAATMAVLGTLSVAQPAQAATPVGVNVCNANFGVTIDIIVPSRGTTWHVDRYCSPQQFYAGDKFVVRVHQLLNPLQYKDLKSSAFVFRWDCGDDIHGLGVTGSNYLDPTVYYSC
ncbi:hypothetical protein [Kineosporia sp. NBRC 101731]|uniref:hypothetical protein n=1 Tax=Kineosporia sp. NBRC 101731 TaxID=3032199 RepID=UPI0024A13615|nr:hypothetical protein [Kineosporia sp. NBRC 101731]GLY28841.1 hypothetical protein Kisp02_22060 [Kineosporia sp. NBRC 101731]